MAVVRPREFIRILSILHFAIMGMLAVFAGGVGFMVSQNVTEVTAETENLRQIFIYVLPAYLLMSLVASEFIFRKMNEKAREEKSLFAKINRYRTATIMRYALIEGPGLLGAVAALLTHEMAFFGAVVVSFLAMGVIRPTLEKAADHLQLEGEERKTLLDDAPDGRL